HPHHDPPPPTQLLSLLPRLAPFIILFIFSSPGTPPVPHSFPTRRSSDLGATPRSCNGSAGPRSPRYGVRSRRLSRRRSAGFCPPDRKSTRLNSSHDQISYAVFCLKKKKQNILLFHHPNNGLKKSHHTTNY